MKIRNVFILATALVIPAAVSAQTEVTGNAGYVSQYYYRGALQKTSSASAGLDVAAGSFSAGTWAADVGDGAEVDLYAGVGFPVGESASVSLGGTGYFYTGQFDDTYLEGNLGIGFGPISIDYALGQYSNFDEDALKYSVLSVTAAADNGLFATIGSSASAPELSDAISDVFGVSGEGIDNTANAWAEAGYGFTAADLDFVISAIYSDAQLSREFDGDGVATQELTFVFGVSKIFSISGM